MGYRQIIISKHDVIWVVLSSVAAQLEDPGLTKGAFLGRVCMFSPMYGFPPTAYSKLPNIVHYV